MKFLHRENVLAMGILTTGGYDSGKYLYIFDFTEGDD